MTEELSGVRLKKLGFELIKEGDLLYFEGPFLSHFRDERGIDYLMNWVDIDNEITRWLLTEVSNEQLQQYFLQKFSLLDLIYNNASGAVYIIDIDSEANYRHIYLTEIKDVPDEYLPKKESYFDAKFAEPYASFLAQESKQQIESKGHSFIDIATKQLFGASRKNEYFNYSINSLWNSEPDSIDEMIAAKLLVFPLLIHYHQHRNKEIEQLLLTHSQAYTNPVICRAYLHNVQKIVLGNDNNSTDLLYVNAMLLLRQIINSTEKIVRNHPASYATLYTDWKKSIEKEWENIGGLDKALHSIS